VDLAKIRKKAMLSQAVTAWKSAQEHAANLDAALPVVEPEICVSESSSASDTQFAQQDMVLVDRTPLDIILAGRFAAGCDHERELVEDDLAPLPVDYLDFLSFRVSDEVYGINILDIKEIIKQRTVTEVPRAPAFLSGIISLRGTIIPIIYMRERLGLPKVETTGKERIIVIRNQETFYGLLVDEILKVIRVQQQTVEPAPAVLDAIDRDFVSGIGKSDGRLFIILNLATITGSDEC